MASPPSYSSFSFPHQNPCKRIKDDHFLTVISEYREFSSLDYPDFLPKLVLNWLRIPSLSEIVKRGPLFFTCHFWKPRLESNKHFKVKAGKFRVPLITFALKLFNWKQKYLVTEHREHNRRNKKIHVFTDGRVFH